MRERIKDYDRLLHIREAIANVYEFMEGKTVNDLTNDKLLFYGVVKNVEIIEDGVQGVIRITLKYAENKQKVLTGLKRVSKPGLRSYASCDELPKVLKGLGIAIISTSKGIMTDKEARRQNVGGEVLAFVW